MAKRVHGVPGNSPIADWPTSGEYLDKLNGQQKITVYERMRRGDPQIKAVLRAITLPVQRANYYVEAASESPEDIAIAKFVENNLTQSMNMTWRDTLRHIMLHQIFGYMPLEKIYEYDKELGKVAIRKLDPRLPSSIEKFFFNKEKHTLVSIMQRDTDGKEYTIPIENLVVFTNEKEGDNWEGISLLRSVYGSWWIKNILIKIDSMKHERYGLGIPHGEMPEGTDSESKEWKAMEKTLEAVQAQEQSYIVTPASTKIDILGAGGTKAGTDVLGSVRYHNEQIAVAMLAQFLSLGTTQTGSRALGESFTDFFLMALQETAEYITETLQRYVVRELVDYNWNVKDYPTLKVQQIKELDAQTVTSLKSVGLLTPDVHIENAIRNQLGLPEIDPDEYEERHQAPAVPGSAPTAAKPADVPEKEDEEEPEQPEDKQLHDNLHLADRDLTEEERICNFSAIESRLDASTDSVTQKILDIRQAQIKTVVVQLSGGRRIQNITVPGKKDMYQTLVKAYRDNLQEGKEEMLQEIKSQRPSLVMADPVPDDEIEDLVKDELSMKVEGAGDKLKSMIAAIALDLRKKGVTGDELRRQLQMKVDDKLSEVTWKNLAASAVNQGWGNGRERGLKEYKDDIDYVYRSALLDGNACEVCRFKDGVTHEWGDPEYMTPDPECEGTPARCRCVNIAVMKAESREGA